MPSKFLKNLYVWRMPRFVLPFTDEVPVQSNESKALPTQTCSHCLLVFYLALYKHQDHGLFDFDQGQVRLLPDLPSVPTLFLSQFFDPHSHRSIGSPHKMRFCWTAGKFWFSWIRSACPRFKVTSKLGLWINAILKPLSASL